MQKIVTVAEKDSESERKRKTKDKRKRGKKKRKRCGQRPTMKYRKVLKGREKGRQRQSKGGLKNRMN